MGQCKVYTPVGGDSEDEEKMSLVATETKQKGKLTIDPMMEFSWRSKEYSAPIEETTLLMARMVEMLGTTSRGFAPQTAGVGRMKLEAPS